MCCQHDQFQPSLLGENMCYLITIDVSHNSTVLANLQARGFTISENANVPDRYHRYNITHGMG